MRSKAKRHLPLNADLRLRHYEAKTSAAMAALAITYFVIYTMQVLWISMPNFVGIVLNLASLVIWVIFIADLSIRVYLAPRRWLYLAQHPLDVIAVLVPMVRALRILRVFTAGQWLIARGRHLAIGRTYLAIAVAATLVWFTAALAFYDVERGAPGSMVDSFGDALWWSISTMSTVGYGDVYPVTTEGRIVAAGLMIIGISMLGVITATVASWFVAQTQANLRAEEARKLHRQLHSSKVRHRPNRRLRAAINTRQRIERG